MRVQRRRTRRDHRGEVTGWTHYLTMPKQGMLDFMRVAGREYWARAYDQHTLGIWPGERPLGITRRVRVRRISYRKRGRRQVSYAMTIPAVFTQDLKPGMEAKCLYEGDHLLVVFDEPVFAVHIEVQKRAMPLAFAS